MRRNLDALKIELYNAISNWNDFTENNDGDRILTEEEVGTISDGMFDAMENGLSARGLI